MFDIVEYAVEFFRILGPALQKRWVAEWEAITTHTQGKHPKKFVDTRRPYEDEKIKDYRIANWEPITKDPFGRALNNLQRLFSRSAVTIKYPEALKGFVAGRNFEGTDLDTYMNRFALRRMVEDPNGLLVWWPAKQVMENEEITPVPYLVLSKHIKHLEPEVMSWLSDEKSPVLVLRRGRLVEAMVGDVYYVVSIDGYYKNVQVGRASDKDFEMRPWYQHDLGKLPVILLGGEETGETNLNTKTEDRWFTSYFAPAIPFGNECLRQFSDHQAIMVTSAFPLREMDPVKCVAKGCDKGIVRTPEKKTAEGHVVKWKEKHCTECNGTGKMIPQSPYGVVWRAEKTIMNEGDNKGAAVDVVKFLSPDVEIIKYSGEHWRKLLEETARALYLIFVEEQQSGKAKEIDREDRTSTLDRIGQHFYMNVYLNSLLFIGMLRNVQGTEEETSIALPPSFVVLSEDDMLLAMKSLRDGGINTMIAGRRTVEMVHKMFPGDPHAGPMATVLYKFDPLYGMTGEEKTDLLGQGVVDVLAVQRSTYAATALERMVERDPEVLDMEQEELFGLLEDEIDEMLPEPPDPSLNPIDAKTGLPMPVKAGGGIRPKKGIGAQPPGDVLPPEE